MMRNSMDRVINNAAVTGANLDSQGTLNSGTPKLSSLLTSVCNSNTLDNRLIDDGNVRGIKLFLRDTLLHDKYFGVHKGTVEGIAFYQSGIQSHYGKITSYGFWDPAFGANAKEPFALLSYFGSGFLTTAQQRTTLIPRGFMNTPDLNFYIGNAKKDISTLSTDLFRAELSGSSWGNANFNSTTRFAYNSYHSRLGGTFKLDSWIRCDAALSHERLMRNNKWLEAFCPPPNTQINRFLKRFTHWRVNWPKPVLGKVYDDSFETVYVVLPWCTYANPGSYRTDISRVTSFFFRDFYTPTFSVPSDILSEIFTEQDWLTLLVSCSDDLQVFFSKSKSISFNEINSFWQIYDNQDFEALIAQSYGWWLVIGLFLVTFGELIKDNDKIFRIYKTIFGKFLNYRVTDYNGYRRLLPFFPEYFLFTYFLFAAILDLVEGGTWTNANGACKTMYEELALLFSIENKRAFKVRSVESVFEGTYVPLPFETEYSVNRGAADKFYRHFCPNIHENESLSLLLHLDRYRTSVFNTKLAYDQAIYNFYRHRNGMFSGTSYFYFPGTDYISSFYTNKDYLHGIAWGKPNWYFRMIDLTMDSLYYNILKIGAKHRGRATYLDISHLEKQGFFRLSHVYNVYPEYCWFDHQYNGVVNEANQTPLYDAELVRLRYGFNPYFSNATAYGNKWLRILDTLENQKELPGISFLNLG